MTMHLEEISLDGFRGIIDGKPVRTHLMRNSNGIEVVITNYGPSIIELKAPDRNGRFENIMLRYPSLMGYENDKGYHGRVAVGRVANRIRNACYIQPDSTYTSSDGIIRLSANDGKHALHGGKKGWSSRIWDVSNTKKGPKGCKAEISFVLASPHLEQGFPGNVYATLTATLTEDNKLVFEYRARTDMTTPINCTFHGYFNLEGADSGATVKEHELMMNADRYLAVDKELLLPTGTILTVDGSRLDFRQKGIIGANFGERGFDQCLVFPDGAAGQATLYSPKTGRVVEMNTDQPAVQLDTGFSLQKPFTQFGGVCLEAQKLVDAVNHSEWAKGFGNPFTKPNMEYHQITSYEFKVM